MRQYIPEARNYSLVEERPITCSTGQPRFRLGHPRANAALFGGLHEVFAEAAGEKAMATGFALALVARVNTEHKLLLWERQDFSALEAGELRGNGLLELRNDPARVLRFDTVRAEILRRENMRGANARVRVLVKPDVAVDCPAEFGSSARALQWAARAFSVPARVVA